MSTECETLQVLRSIDKKLGDVIRFQEMIIELLKHPPPQTTVARLNADDLWDLGRATGRSR